MGARSGGARAGGCGRASVASSARQRERGAGGDHDRLGVRQQGPDGAVRRAGARGGQIRVEQINEAGGVDGAQLQIKTCDTQNNNPTRREVVRGEPARRRRADPLRRPATSTSRRRSCRRRSTRACSRSRRASAPTRWGRSASARKGKLAFSFGNVAQDEGSAMAEYACAAAAGARRRSRRTPCSSTSRTSSRRSRSASRSSAARSPRARATRPARTTSTRRSAASTAQDADVIVTSTAFGELPALVAGPPHARQQDADPQLVGRRRHVLAAEEPAGRRTTTRVTYASVFGDDPNPAVKRLIAGMKAASAAPGHRRLRHRRGGDRRRRRPRSSGPAARRTAPRSPRSSRSSRASTRARRQDQLLEAAAQRVRAAVPRDPDPEQQGASTSARSRRRSSRRSDPWMA